MRLRYAVVLSAVATAVSALSASAETGATATWSGTWSRAEDGVAGNLILKQTGSSVSGSYTWNDGSGRVSGTVSGATFTGGFNETHYQGSFVLNLSGKRFTGSYTGKNKDTGGAISGPFDGACVAGPCLTNGAAPPATTTTATTPAPPGGGGGSLREGHVTGVTGTAYFHKGGTPADAWLPLDKDTVLKPGDSLTTDADASITIAFANGESATLSDLTDLSVTSLSQEGGIFRTQLDLKWGQIRAELQKAREGEVSKSDMVIKSPTAVSSVRGTIFTVFYDPGSHTSVTSVTRGVVEVDPVKPGLPTEEVPAGKAVEVSSTAISPLAPVGKVDVRGGIDRQTALRLTARLVGAAVRACKLKFSRSSSFAVASAPGGWLVSVRTTAGKAKGISTWLAVGRNVTPVNAAAKKIAAHCR